MLYGDYSFSCVFETPARLPFYKGSALRGVFGRSLKKTVCALRRQECDTCLLNTTCLYAVVFETPVSAKASEAPHPFVLEPPLTPKADFAPGDGLSFSLLLFGSANNSLPYFIYAVDKMGPLGIGARIDGRRGRFALVEVKAGRKTVYRAEDRRVKTQAPVETLALSSETGPSQTGRLVLTLETPLRMKTQNRLTADLPFHALVRAMLRRVSTLMAHYGEGEPPLDYKGLVKRAMDVKIVENNLQWFDWRRYSFRQDNEMLMGGITGSVVYEGELDEFLPLVRFCEKAHVGKQTTFGLGKIKATTV
ncbi:MAG: CRISPR system precrRNA processing endoribonuclease RAMP protein Cas6 [Thermodesulfobacteriota bacterium]